MACSSYCFIVVSFAVLLVSSSSQTSTKLIDAVCQHDDFCTKALMKYHPAVSATTKLKAAAAALLFVRSHADKFADLAGKAAKENPNLKEQFEECQAHFHRITTNLWSATGELVESPETANYDAMICTDETTAIKNLIGKNKDKDSKKIIKITFMMEKLIPIAVGATVAVGG